MSYRTQPAPGHGFGEANERRADYAEAILHTYSDCNFPSDGQDGVGTDMSDVLANMRHLCDRAGLDFDEIVGRSERSYEGDAEDGPPAARDSSRFAPLLAREQGGG